MVLFFGDARESGGVRSFFNLKFGGKFPHQKPEFVSGTEKGVFLNFYFNVYRSDGEENHFYFLRNPPEKTTLGAISASGRKKFKFLF